jgi:hypothetical protein
MGLGFEGVGRGVPRSGIGKMTDGTKVEVKRPLEINIKKLVKLA